MNSSFETLGLMVGFGFSIYFYGFTTKLVKTDGVKFGMSSTSIKAVSFVHAFLSIFVLNPMFVLAVLLKDIGSPLFAWAGIVIVSAQISSAIILLVATFSGGSRPSQRITQLIEEESKKLLTISFCVDAFFLGMSVYMIVCLFMLSFI